MILLIVGGLSLLVIVFFRAYNAPLPTITHWTRDATGAALSVGTYSNPDYASYEWTQRALGYTGGALLAAGIAWCLIWAPIYNRRWCSTHHICPKCGYDRRATKGLPCPECGWRDN